jgi:hypothetical protein
MEAKNYTPAQGRVLYRISMSMKTKPTSAVEKSKFFNRMDEAHGLLCMSISPYLWFYINACNTTNDIWTTLVCLFGKKDEMRGHFLEVELNSMDPKNFDSVQYFFTKFKSLLHELIDYGIDKSKQEKQLVLTIMEKIGPQYSVFVSIIHSNRFTT